MKTILRGTVLIFAVALIGCQSESETKENVKTQGPSNSKNISLSSKSTNHLNTGGLQWFTIEEALERQKKDPKIMFVDVYTEWCGWCKVMDKKTFTDPEVQAFISENFIPVKFDAEQKTAINFGGKQYNYVPGGRRGHNQLAAHLLNGRLGYPSFAYLDANLKNLKVSPGYKKPDQLMSEMKAVLSRS